MKSFVFGGSAGLGRQICRELAAAGHDLTIVSRDNADLVAECKHCSIVYGVSADWIAVDAADPAAVEASLERYLAQREAIYDNLIFPVGGASGHDSVDSTPAHMIATVHVNLTSIMVAVRTLLPRMKTAGTRNIIGFSSIAAFRGRRSNACYAAAKRGLESYFESLRHSLQSSGIRVKLYRLGYVATQQSFGKRLPLPVSLPENIARRVLNDWQRDTGMTTAPRFWALVGFALRRLPWRIFRRLNF